MTCNLTLELVQGMNLISLPISDPSITDASSLAAKIGANCTEIVKFNSATQQYVSYLPGWSPLNNFAIVGGEGYIVTVNSPSNLELSGIGWVSPFSISLVTGDNMIGYPINDPTAATAADWIFKIGGNCAAISKWDVATQKWQSYNTAMPPQADFFIVVGEGYYVSMIGAGELILEGESWCPTGRVPPCGNYGDLDNDGYVTVNDAILVANYAVGGWSNVSADTPLTETEFVLRAEVNADGVVDMADSTYIANYAMYVQGYDTFPICEVCPKPQCTFTIT